MANRKAFTAMMAMLGETFRRDLTEPMMDGYWMALEDLTEDEFRAAATRAVRECKFMPAPSELRAFVRQPRNVESEALEAWEAVRGAIDKHDYTDSVDFGPLVNAVVRNLGGWYRLCDLKLEQLDVWTRKEFERVYGEFAHKDPSTLHGDAHIGAFNKVPVRIAIGGVKPLPQLEPPPTNGAGSVRQLIRDLANGKS